MGLCKIPKLRYDSGGLHRRDIPSTTLSRPKLRLVSLQSLISARLTDARVIGVLMSADKYLIRQMVNCRG